MKKTITPIIIIGAARNGTTNLENLVASLPSIAGVEHWLHHGSMESYVYLNQQFWGDMKDRNRYLQFLYQYSGSDYFQQCGGDVEYYLNNPVHSFYNFFLDLMDRHTARNDKNYWVTKLDSCFFYDDKERKKFISLLYDRYETVKFIRIQRPFKAAFNSYRHMEGKQYTLRQKNAAILPALLYQAARYSLIYNKNIGSIPDDVLSIQFDHYIKNREGYRETLAHFLNLPPDSSQPVETNRFDRNTSFHNQSKKELPAFITSFIPHLLTFYRRFPRVAQWIWKAYYWTKRNEEPFFRRFIKLRYFKQALIDKLTAEHALDLVEKIKAYAREADQVQ